MQKKLLIIVAILISLAGCQTFKATLKDNQKRRQCGQRIIDALDTCVGNWSPFGCYRDVKNAGKDCLTKGSFSISPNKLICNIPYMDCTPPGTLG